ncbi:MAG: hypothetical protein GY870_11465 [archaeon]|nr:hypothetical protein [archaeon]
MSESIVEDLNGLGAIIIIIDCILGLFNAFGKNIGWELNLLVLILGIIILVITPQLERVFKIFWTAIIGIILWIITNYGGVWESGAGFIGMIILSLNCFIIYLSVSFAVFVSGSLGTFKPYEYLTFGTLIVAIQCTIQFIGKILNPTIDLASIISEIVCYGCIGCILLGTLLIKVKKKLLGATIVWIFSNLVDKLTGINGFDAGLLILQIFSVFIFALTLMHHWSNPFTKTMVPRNQFWMTVRDSYFAFFPGLLTIMLWPLTRKKNKKRGALSI